MNLVELITTIALIMIIIIVSSFELKSATNINNQARYKIQQITLFVHNLQIMSRQYHRPIIICGIKSNRNLTLHNCSKDQRNWSDGMMAYIDYAHLHQYQNNIADEKKSLLTFTETKFRIINNSGSEWVVGPDGKLKTSYSIYIDDAVRPELVLIDQMGNFSSS